MNTEIIKNRVNKLKFRKAPPKLGSDSIKIIPISGVEFIGSNCTAFEYKDEVVVIDAGIGFPNADQYGVDFLIPNPKYFQQNQKKIKALLITHGHLDHIGAVPYMLESMGFPPIYASRFAAELIKANISYNHKHLITKLDIRIVDITKNIRIGAFEVGFFGVNHSIPESMGVILKTPIGNIVHSGDFKFDNSPLNGPVADYAKIAQIGASGVLCLLSDSTNSYKEGHSPSESEITDELDNLISSLKGRVIIATFSSMVNRIIELLKLAQKYNRKVFISGRSMANAIEIARKIGYINVPNELFVQSGKKLSEMKDSNIMVLATGSQGEALAALGRMARGEHKDITIKNADSVILSSSVIPGNGALVQEMIDQLTKLGANVYHNEIMNLHTTGHGHKEEQKLMINLVQPKFFIPVHGFQSFLYEHAKTASSLGVKKENIIMPLDGSVIEMSRHGWKYGKKLNLKPLNVSGSIVGDVGRSVLDDRQQLANYGVVVYSLVIDKQSNKLISDPDIASRGFVFMKQSKDLIQRSKEIIQETYNGEISDYDEKLIKEKIEKNLSKFFYKMTEREPMILGILKYL